MNADDLYHKYYINNRNNRDGHNEITVVRMRNQLPSKKPIIASSGIKCHQPSNSSCRPFRNLENAIYYRTYQDIFGLVA